MTRNNVPPHLWSNLRRDIALTLDIAESEAVKHAEVGLSLFRQLVRGKNSLRTLEMFPCNQAEHEDVDCKCFWEQCEAWASRDKEEPAWS